jgi:hypothetical protein
LGPLFEGLQADKSRNLKSLQNLVLIATNFIYDVKKSNFSVDSSESHSSRVSDEYHEVGRNYLNE